jgi:hypothetical protein
MKSLDAKFILIYPLNVLSCCAHVVSVVYLKGLDMRAVKGASDYLKAASRSSLDPVLWLWDSNS